MEKGEDLWRNYTVDLSVKISELSGGQSHMLRINGRSGPLILHPLFSGLDKLDFGDGKVAWPFVSLDRFGAIHYTAGWGKVSMWPGRPVFSLHTAAGWAQLSHTHSLPHSHRCCYKLRTALTPHHHVLLLLSLLPYSTASPLCYNPPNLKHPHTLASPDTGVGGWVGAWLGVGWGVNLLCSITRKAGEHNATASLWGRTSACPHHLLLSLHPPSLRALHTSVSISLHGSDLTPRHASHPGVHHHQCVCGLQHPGRAPDWTGTGHLQTREVRVGPQGSRAQEKGKFRALKEETWNNCLFLESSCFYFAFSSFFCYRYFFLLITVLFLN